MYFHNKAKKETARKFKKDGGFHWLCCIDGSESSYDALNETMRIIDVTCDFLDCVCVETSKIKPKLIEKAVEAQAKNMKAGHYRFVGIPNNEKLSEADLILKFFKIKELDYDIVVLGSKGNEFVMHDSKKYLGSVVSALLKHIPANVLLVP